MEIKKLQVKTMTKLIMFTILLIFCTLLHAQSALQLEGSVIEAFSSEQKDFTGILASPKLGPHPSQVFSFEKIASHARPNEAAVKAASGGIVVGSRKGSAASARLDRSRASRSPSHERSWCD